MNRPRLLDLYCCQGGAAMGYHRAGFDIVGVDITPQPRYPFEFVQGDALDYLAEHGHEYDAIHASPPCHDHSSLSALSGMNGSAHLLDATRTALVAAGRPYVIENVERAPMPGSLVLCGTEFGLGARDRSGVWRELRRHRRFESKIDLWGAGGCHHNHPAIGVYGDSSSARDRLRKPGQGRLYGYKANRAEAAEALGIHWMTRGRGMSQAIPPAYTEFIGEQLLQNVLASVA